MDGGGGTENGSRTGSVKAAVHMFGEKMNPSSSPMRKPYQKIDFLQTQPSKARELHLVKKSISDLNENSRAAESKAQADVELLRAKKTVKELAFKIEESSSRAKRNQNELQKLNDMKTSKEGEETEDQHHYDEARRELELLKGKLSKLRVEIELVKEETSRAHEEAEISNGKKESYLTTVESLRKEIEEVNEEQVLVELAAIEALKELSAIEAQRKDEAGEYSSSMEKMNAKMSVLVDELKHVEEIKEELAIVESDINMLQGELDSVKELEQKVGHNGTLEHSGVSLQELSLQWKSIMEEVEEGKKQLASIRLDGFQVMSMMDVVRREKIKMTEEITLMKKCNEKADKTVKSLNLKLLRARNKLETASKGEEKAKGILSSMMMTLDQLRKDTEVANEETKLLMEETESVKMETRRIESEMDSTQEKLQAALQELELLGSSELEALEKLRGLTEDAMRKRETASQHESTIKISKFEYEYLCGSAAAAQETADKKVAAAEEWITALKASEREARAKIEKVQKESSDLRLKEEQEIYQKDRSLTAKQLVQGELQTQRDRWRRSSEVDDDKMTPSRRAKLRRSTSPAIKLMSPHSTSFTVKRRRKVMPIIAKYFANKHIERGSSYEEL